MERKRLSHFNMFSKNSPFGLGIAFLLACLVTLTGCKESNEIENLFEGEEVESDPEVIEVPPENDLSIAITDPAADGTTIGYEKTISGTCGTVGLIIQIEGDIETFGVCGVDLTWSVVLDATSVGAGTVSIDARLVDGETLGNPVTRTFSKVSTACDTEAARFRGLTQSPVGMSGY